MAVKSYDEVLWEIERALSDPGVGPIAREALINASKFIHDEGTAYQIADDMLVERERRKS